MPSADLYSNSSSKYLSEYSMSLTILYIGSVCVCRSNNGADAIAEKIVMAVVNRAREREEEISFLLLPCVVL